MLGCRPFHMGRLILEQSRFEANHLARREAFHAELALHAAMDEERARARTSERAARRYASGKNVASNRPH